MEIGDIGVWFKRQTKERPFICALIITLLCLVPGYLRVEGVVSKANDAASSAQATADQLKVITENDKARDRVVTRVNCETRNNANRNGRKRFDTLFTAIETIFSSSPGAQDPNRQQQIHAFVDSLRKAVPLDANAEDVDCNGNGKLDPQDYG